MAQASEIAKNHEQKNYYIVGNFLNLIIIHINHSFK